MMIELQDLRKQYGAATALDGLTMTVPDNMLYAFLGPNGAGKTTTIRILNGLTRPTSGSARIAGARVGTDADSPAAKRLCGLASQNINLDGELTVAQNLEFHGRLYGMPRRERRHRADELLSYIEMSDRADSLVKTLSGGLKRRVQIARALLHRPRLLFLDEPTAGLDPALRRRLWNLVKRVRLDGVTVFLTTHYLEDAESLADRVGLIHKGRLVTEGSPNDLMGRVGEWAVDAVGESDLSTSYHQTREEASRAMRAGSDGLTLRRVNLEDAFLRFTGERVE